VLPPGSPASITIGLDRSSAFIRVEGPIRRIPLLPPPPQIAGELMALMTESFFGNRPVFRCAAAQLESIELRS
jgi:hypothetical protein